MSLPNLPFGSYSRIRSAKSPSRWYARARRRGAKPKTLPQCGRARTASRSSMAASTGGTAASSDPGEMERDAVAVVARADPQLVRGHGAELARSAAPRRSSRDHVDRAPGRIGRSGGEQVLGLQLVTAARGEVRAGNAAAARATARARRAAAVAEFRRHPRHRMPGGVGQGGTEPRPARTAGSSPGACARPDAARRASR